VGDFDGDTDLDLAVANYGSDNVSILLNRGDGTFAAAVGYGAGVFPISVAVGDFDGDADLDLAVASNGSSFSSGDVSVLLGNGDGTFAVAVSYAAGAFPNSVAVGDFDGDTDLDLAVSAGNRFSSSDVSVLLGNGDATFAAAVSYGAGGSSVAVGDFDGDTDLDLAGANPDSAARAEHRLVPYDPPGDVSILLGSGDGTFAPAVSYAAGVNPWSVAVGDFDGDTDLDLAVAVRGHFGTGGGVLILLGNGDGTFASVGGYGVGSTPSSVAVGNFDGDTDLDLAIASAGNTSILLGNGDGTFAAAVSYGAGETPQSVAVGDFDGDTDLDLAVANTGGVSILLNSCACANGAVDPDTGECEPGLPLGDRCGQDGECSTDFCVDGVCCQVSSCPAEESCQRFSGVCAPPGDCVGDCNGNGEVVIGELVMLVNIGLGEAPASACPNGVPDGVAVDIALIIQAVDHGLHGCNVSEKRRNR
jgi:hypothetical protein